MAEIYPTKIRYERKIKQIKEDPDLSERNKELLLSFRDDLFSEGLTLHRVLFYLDKLHRLSKWIDKDIDKVEKQDLKKIVARIETSDYSEWTKKDYKVTIKKFFKWLNGGEEYPDYVKWIKTTMKEDRKKLPEDLLTEEEVKKLMESAENLRDKTMISVLYEGGLRIGELLDTKIKHVSFDRHGAVIMVHGKTGWRRVRLIASTSLLVQYLENHPLKDDPNSPLWIGLGTRNKNKALDYAATRRMLKRLSDKAGIKKKIHCHLFRHSRATQLASHLTEAQMNHHFGWVQGSKMPSTYVHLSGRDIDRGLLQFYGIEDEEEIEKPILKPVKCKKCKMDNHSTATYCSRCGAILDEKKAIELEMKEAELAAIFSELVSENPGLVEDFKKFVELINLLNKNPELLEQVKSLAK